MAAEQMTARKPVARHSATLFRTVLERAPDLTLVLDQQGTVRYASPAIEAIVHYRRSEWQGTSLLAWVHPDDAPALGAALWYVTRTQPHPRLEVRVRRRDGAWSVLDLLISNLLSDPAVGGLVVHARDVTERWQREERLRRLAYTDYLTGLSNRMHFLDRLAHALDRGPRQPAGLAVIFLDLDGFKRVNDQLGHAAGDDLLIGVGRRLLACVRPADTVARLGGDEFTIVLEDIAGADGAIATAERILALLRQPFALDNGEAIVTTSIGITVCHTDQPGLSPELLLRTADQALAGAKHAGKDRWELIELPLSAALAAPSALTLAGARPERRRHPRLPANGMEALVVAADTPGPEQTITARVLDLSPGGAHLHLTAPVLPNERYTLRLPLSGGETFTTITAELAWVRPYQQAWHAGVAFRPSRQAEGDGAEGALLLPDRWTA